MNESEPSLNTPIVETRSNSRLVEDDFNHVSKPYRENAGQTSIERGQKFRKKAMDGNNYAAAISDLLGEDDLTDKISAIISKSKKKIIGKSIIRLPDLFTTFFWSIIFKGSWQQNESPIILNWL